MKILITTGLSKSDIGGPFQYAHNLEREFKGLGHEVRIGQYYSVERAFFGIWPQAIWADKILALDTFSVGLPSILASRILRKKAIIRVGGDFLWSAYVNRTGEPIPLPDFYKKMPSLNFKEKIIFVLTKWLLRNAGALAFNTEWQRNIWREFYRSEEGGSVVVRNFIPEKNISPHLDDGKFLWAGRLIPEKNPRMLEKLGVEIATGEPHERILQRLAACRAAVSLAFTDICPNFIIEAVSLGKPFIMTKHTGLGEIFSGGGAFVDPLDEEAIRQAMDNPPPAATQYAPHSWRQMAESYINIWKGI